MLAYDLLVTENILCAIFLQDCCFDFADVM